MADRGDEANLRSAVAAGDAEARPALGQLLFLQSHSEASRLEGMQLLTDAAHDGHGGAAHFLALITGGNTELEDNWVYALAYLGRAADAGHGLAQRQLAFLAGEPDIAQRIIGGEEFLSETWHRLHDAIDVAALIAPPPLRVISVTPYVAIVEGLATPAACDWIVERARPELAPAKIYNPEGGGTAGLTRSNSEMRFAAPELDLVLLFLRQRIAVLTGLGVDSMETTAVLHYAVGQEFKPHYDFLNPAVPAYAAEIAEFGQRLATVLIYLNDDFDGGETDFLRLGRRYKGKKGDAVIFHNVDKTGAPDLATLHAGRATTRGEKWLLSQWLRGTKLPL